jgi:uncharacterized protein (DUF2461 family)
MLARSTADFLRKLAKNNNRDWFNANKSMFVAANDNIIALTAN